MKDKVLRFIEQKNLIQKNDSILVALSGGPDSVCLLHILLELRDKLGINIAAAHVNHMLRGADADADEGFVQKLCNENNIKCYIKRVDINIIKQEEGLSHELAGRRERYKFFEEICKEGGYNKVAIAHNLNDNVETVFMRVIRGTGLDGLVGIRSKRDNIIRPIMCLSRKEIEDYIEKRSLEACLDKSNLEKEYNRNKVRLDLIPYISQNFNSDLIKSVNRMTDLLDIDNDYIEEQAQNIFNKYVTIDKKKVRIDLNLTKQHRAIFNRVIRKALMLSANTTTDFENKHINDIYDLFFSDTGKKLNMPNSIIVEKVYGDIIIYKISDKSKEVNKSIDGKNSLELNDINNKIINYGDYIIKFNKILKKNYREISNNDLIKLFDYDNIKEGVEIRVRQDGDKFKPLGMKGTKKLKDIFINLKIPRDIRDEIPLVCFDNNIAWIVGYRQSEDFKVTNQTENILKITIERKNGR